MHRLAGKSSLLLALIAIALSAESCRAVYDLGALGAGSTDSGADAASDAADAGPRFCERATPKPAFCSDFDDTQNPLIGWDNDKVVPDPFVHGGGSFPGAVTSRDTSRAWVSELVATKSSASAALAKYVVLGRPGFYLAFDVSVEGTDPRTPDERVVLTTIVIGSTPENFLGQVSLAYDKKGGLYVGVSPANSEPAEGEFVASPVGRGWMRIEIILDRRPLGTDAGSGGSVEVYVDGSRTVRTGLPKILTTRDDGVVTLGAFRALEGADARVLVDNVIID